MTAWGCSLKGVSVRWNQGRQILEDINLEIPADEISRLPIIGRSGVGKSTQLYVLAALKWPTSGTVSWTFPDGESFTWGAQGDGLSLADTVHLRRSYFGFSFQASTLCDHLLVRENLRYPLHIRGDPGRDGNRPRKSTPQLHQESVSSVREALLKVLFGGEIQRVDEILNSFPSQLSGGQKQRVALAQAMIHNPNVLFADEPAGNLDPDSRLQVMNVLKEWLAQGRGSRLLVWVTHHPDDPQVMSCTDVLEVVHREGGMQGAEARLESLREGEHE